MNNQDTELMYRPIAQKNSRRRLIKCMLAWVLAASCFVIILYILFRDKDDMASEEVILDSELYFKGINKTLGITNVTSEIFTTGNQESLTTRLLDPFSASVDDISSTVNHMVLTTPGKLYEILNEDEVLLHHNTADTKIKCNKRQLMNVITTQSYNLASCSIKNGTRVAMKYTSIQSIKLAGKNFFEILCSIKHSYDHYLPPTKFRIIDTSLDLRSSDLDRVDDNLKDTMRHIISENQFKKFNKLIELTIKGAIKCFQDLRLLYCPTPKTEISIINKIESLEGEFPVFPEF